MAVSKAHSHISNLLINRRKLEPHGIIDSSNKLILQEFLEMCWLEQVGSTNNKDKVSMRRGSSVMEGERS